MLRLVPQGHSKSALISYGAYIELFIEPSENFALTL